MLWLQFPFLIRFCHISTFTVVITEALLILATFYNNDTLLAVTNVLVSASIMCLLVVCSYFISDGLGLALGVQPEEILKLHDNAYGWRSRDYGQFPGWYWFLVLVRRDVLTSLLPLAGLWSALTGHQTWVRQIPQGNKWGFQACLVARHASVPVVHMENRAVLTDWRPSYKTCHNARVHTRKHTWHLSHYHNVTDLPVSLVDCQEKK